MKLPCRYTAAFGVFVVLAFVATMTQSGFAQILTNKGPAAPSYLRMQPTNIHVVTPFSPGTVLVMPSNAKTTRGLSPFAATNNASTQTKGSASTNAATTTSGGGGGNIIGLQTIPTFAGAFAGLSGPDAGNVFPFIMIGNDPLVGGTTTIPTNMTEVSLQLLNPDGTVFTNVPFAPFEDLTTDSPNFFDALYESANGRTQYADAIQRAEYFNLMKNNWHTELGQPNIVNRVVIQVPYSVFVQLPDGSIIQARSYFTGKASDGSTYTLMLDLLFNFFYDNQVVADINANNFTTNAVNIDMFPNTFTFSLNTSDPNTPGNCCTLGFHTYFFDPTVTPQPRWITIFASWISPGLFGGGFGDIAGLSHEISESFNDPFINNIVPTWQFPDQPPSSTVCQNNLETGDPVEVLPTAALPITLKEGHEIFTYHPQTEALLQWFEMGATSNAINGAFSFPDETALTHSAVPCPVQ